MYSAYKLNKQGDNIQPWCPPFPILNQSTVPCLVLTVASWPAYRFLRRQVKVIWYSHLFKNFPQSVVIHTVQGFSIVNEADVFLEFSFFFYNSADVGNLIFGSSAFSKSSLNIWKFSVHVLSKPSLENFEHYFASMWDECNWEVVEHSWASLVAQLVKNPLAMRETWVWSLGWEDPLEKGMATHSSILAWSIPWTIWSMGSQRVRHDWVTFTFTWTFFGIAFLLLMAERCFQCVYFPMHFLPYVFFKITDLLKYNWLPAAAAAAKLHQSCLTLCGPIDGSPPGSRPWYSPGKYTGVSCRFLL